MSSTSPRRCSPLAIAIREKERRPRHFIVAAHAGAMLNPRVTSPWRGLLAPDGADALPRAPASRKHLHERSRGQCAALCRPHPQIRVRRRFHLPEHRAHSGFGGMFSGPAGAALPSISRDEEALMESRTESREPASHPWSHSRETTLRTCARQYYYRYLLARGGWKRSAPARVRLAYVLSRLTTLDLALGNVLHALAARVTYRVLARQPRPTADVLRQSARAHLNALVRNGRDLAAFAADPAGHPVLIEAYYGRELSGEQVERVRRKLERCTRNLAESTVWSELERCAPDQVHAVDAPVTFSFAGTTIWLAPDLVYTPAAGPPVVLDWKSGRVSIDSAVDQLGLYASYARVQLALDLPATGFDGQVADLSTGERWSVPLTAEALAAAETRVRDGVLAMGQLPDDPAQSGTEAAYPRTSDRVTCRSCPYWAFCEPDLRS